VTPLVVWSGITYIWRGPERVTAARRRESICVLEYFSRGSVAKGPSGAFGVSGPSDFLGSLSDPYAVFARTLAGGNPPDDWPALLAAAEAPEAVRRSGAVDDEAG